MLLFSGHWIKALILLAWGLVVVHPIDNVLRPYLIGERTKLSTLFVFFAILGGLRTFGAMGVFIGPTILAATLALVSFLREENRQGRLGFELPSAKSSPQRGSCRCFKIRCLIHHLAFQLDGIAPKDFLNKITAIRSKIYTRSASRLDLPDNPYPIRRLARCELGPERAIRSMK